MSVRSDMTAILAESPRHASITRLSWTPRWTAPPQPLRPALRTASADAVEALDAILSRIGCGRVESAVADLRQFLHDCRRGMWPGAWQVFARSVIRDHPVLDLIHQSPVSGAMYHRAGPVAPDLERFLSPVLNGRERKSDSGARIATCELAGDTPQAIRSAREELRRLAADCLLRSARALVVTDAQAIPPVRDVDFIGVSGACEALPDAAVERLVATLFAKLAPGGRLVVTHLTSAVTDRAYLEACMDCWIACRDESAIRRLCGSVRSAAVSRSFVGVDSRGHVARLELVRRARRSSRRR